MKIVENSLKIVSFLLIIFFILLLLVTIFGNRTSIKESPLVGKKAPDIHIESFDGTKIQLRDYNDKIVLLNFWASWCMPCKQEAPEIDSSWNKYRNSDVVFIGINILDDESNARRYLDEYKPEYLNGYDREGNIALEFGVSGVPETYFIGKDSIIMDKYVGPLSEELIHKYIDRIKSNRS